LIIHRIEIRRNEPIMVEDMLDALGIEVENDPNFIGRGTWYQILTSNANRWKHIWMSDVRIEIYPLTIVLDHARIEINSFREVEKSSIRRDREISNEKA